jgi:predicted NAD/FAD-binding protein
MTLGTDRRSVAVVGAGVAGLTAAHLLQRAYDVTLFEAEDRLGGHAHTHRIDRYRVDSGFIVHNSESSPHLTQLFRELGVATQVAEMNLSVSCAGCGLEYAGAKGTSGLFAQRRVDPRFLRMLAEVPRFHRQARALLAPDRTLGEFLADGRYSPYFVHHFAIPLVAAVWSSPSSSALDYPARHMFVFLANHGMLSVTGSLPWKTVVGGSQAYVEQAAKGLNAVHTATPVRAISRRADGVEIRDDGDYRHRFDAVVLATHPDQALRLLATPTPAERDVLGEFRYARSPAVLHTDESVLPRAKGARASWNYAMRSCTAVGGQVSYDLNRLQRLDNGHRFLMTLNGTVPSEDTLARMDYEHPVFTASAVAAQKRLPELNDGTLAFAGAYQGWGFHEDGCRSGVNAAASLGILW